LAHSKNDTTDARHDVDHQDAYGIHPFHVIDRLQLASHTRVASIEGGIHRTDGTALLHNLRSAAIINSQQACDNKQKKRIEDRSKLKVENEHDTDARHVCVSQVCPQGEQTPSLPFTIFRKLPKL
jgi:hypothetical protein